MAGVKGVVEVDRRESGEDVGLQHGARMLQKPAVKSVATKPAKIFNAMWPASMLAKRRTERLIGREMKEITSIATIRGRSQAGTPDGTKRPKKCAPCLNRP